MRVRLDPGHDPRNSGTPQRAEGRQCAGKGAPARRRPTGSASVAGGTRATSRVRAPADVRVELVSSISRARAGVYPRNSCFGLTVGTSARAAHVVVAGVRVQSSAASVTGDRPVATFPAASGGRGVRARLASTGSAAGRLRERRLIREAQRGSAEAFEGLFRQHWPAAYRAAWLVVRDSAAAEDIAQEAFLAAVRALDRFDRRRPFGPWLHRIVLNRAIDAARARALRREVGEDAASPAAADPPHSPLSDELTVALAELGPEQRAVVALRYLLEYTPGEIADLLELPRGTVNSRLRRALDRLGELLGEEE